VVLPYRWAKKIKNPREEEAWRSSSLSFFCDFCCEG
jgi:hypothetical protein